MHGPWALPMLDPPPSLVLMVFFVHEQHDPWALPILDPPLSLVLMVLPLSCSRLLIVY